MSQDCINFGVEIQDHVAEVTLRGPKKGNPMGPDFFDELPTVFESIDANPQIRCVLLAAEGKNFSYGLDLMAAMPVLGPIFADPSLKNRQIFLTILRRWQASIDAVASCRVPVVAAIQGWCIGGGLDLVTACDIRLAEKSAAFSLRETRIAMVADLGSLQRLPGIVGRGHARQMAYTGEDIGAERSLRMGLINELYEDPEALMTAARDLCGRIAANSPQAVQGCKEVMEHMDRPVIDRGLAFVGAWNSAFLISKDLGEAVAAFAQKREPVFTGE